MRNKERVVQQINNCLMYIDPADTKAWAEELKDYQGNRKQKVDFQKPKIYTQKEMKLKQTEFNPVLQTFQNPERDVKEKEKDFQKTSTLAQKKMEMVKKYLHEYDLVNLEQVQGIERPDEREKTKQCLLPPNFNDYNIITNEKKSEEYYKNMKVVVQKRVHEKPVINRNKRDFNIITNKFLENHESKAQEQETAVMSDINDKCKRVRNYDIVAGTFYNDEKEQEFQQKLKQDQFNHGKHFNDRFPPSWKFRESVYLDQTKEIPEEIKMIDEINRNHKKRYEIRHVLENEYRERDLQDQLRTQDRLIKRHKYDDLIKKYDKEFDIITLEKPEIDHIVKALPPKPPLNSWDKVQMTKSGSDAPIHEVSIPEGVDFKENGQNRNDSQGKVRFPQVYRQGSEKSQKSVSKSNKSGPKSIAQSQKSNPGGTEIKSGGFF
ncbi:unnamed protein product (macronuclear) [Paramecium tetraurelia]|uniref:Uncharacterized protein n=1 Tax=Paramecium tetraurelia TaxID=5888 RepID=A0BW51_PARTE|nr:uncharacterized protein GSPATT00032620001 [Paramecium tetraurelia]CAK62768.1 unnamed protein product [Paramecium tetraurelia]|eukprot:XP_001430166.1 hypothetical protein (macronuclear) [Paramecium tetraurelia strain d4-2]